eukprot:578195-Rhodomonas_salina.1
MQAPSPQPLASRPSMPACLPWSGRTAGSWILHGGNALWNKNHGQVSARCGKTVSTAAPSQATDSAKNQHGGEQFSLDSKLSVPRPRINFKISQN